jgi:hypothetical protein
VRCSRVDLRSSELPMGTSPGTPDTKLSRAVGGGKFCGRNMAKIVLK